MHPSKPTDLECYNLAELGRALFEEVSDAVFLFDPETEHLLDVNPVAEQLSLFTRQQLLRMQVSYLFRSEVQGGLNRLREAFLRTGAFQSQEGFFLRTQHDGAWIPVNLALSRLHVQPKTLGLIMARDVREQQQAHAQLQRMEAELQRILASVPDCLWSATIECLGQWHYRYLSPVITRLTGQPPEFFLAGTHRWCNTVHPEDRPRWEKAFNRLHEGQPVQEEYRIVRPDGSIRWVRDNVSVSAATDGRSLCLDGVLTDITERKRAEQALRDSEALYHSLVENIPLNVFRKDLHGRFTFANCGFCNAVGKPLGEILGKTDFDFFPRELAEKYRQDDRTVVEQRDIFKDTEKHQTPAGKKLYVEVIKTPVYDAHGAVVGLQGLFWDVTDRVRAEEVMRETAEESRVARHIQRRLFPVAAPVVPGFDIAGDSYPAAATGGDYFDYLPMGEEGLGIAIGDVVGHGFGPALLMADIRAYLRMLTQMHTGVGEILTLANGLIAADFADDHFITLLYARLDLRKRSLVYANAGHPAGYVLDRTGAVKDLLASTDKPLGIDAQSRFSVAPAVALEPGDLVLLLTDGLLETPSLDRTEFGMERALEVVRRHRGEAAGAIVKSLYNAACDFGQGEIQRDDITALVIKVEGDASWVGSQL